MNRERWVTHGPQETVALGASLARRLRRGDVVALIGELGSGKTQFVKGVAEAFGAHPHVSSPTFVIMNRYDGVDAEGRELFLFHVDLYRLGSPEAILDLGLEEIFAGDGITLIEWADRMGSLVPPQRITVECSFGVGEEDRVIDWSGRSLESVQERQKPGLSGTASSA
jgi:tRNA threonylcarbamoyladenosine biosynthesis protein TsaE